MSFLMKTSEGLVNIAGGGGGASTAKEINYDNTASGIEAENVQTAIDELKNDFDTEIDDVNTLITSKANADDVYTKAETYSKSEVYTKTQTDKAITDEVAKIVAGAPEDFDTLKEMSDWLNNHEESAAAMNTAIQGKITAPQIAAVGQFLSVKAIDDDGKPTEWEAVDSSGDGFNYPDEIAFPGDQLYVKEVGADGKPTAWSYMKSEPIMVYDTEERTDIVDDEDLIGYNFLDADGNVTHTMYRSDKSTLTIDEVEYDLSSESVIIGSENNKNYMVIKKTGSDVTVYRYIDGKLSGSSALEIRTDPLAPIMNKDIADLTYDEIAIIVRAGRAEEKFKIGDQIVTTYTDTSGTQYEMPFDVVAFREVELEDGSIVPGMIIQSHYATVESMQFDAPESSSPNSDVKNYGWNRWMYSGIRQWLNSNANKGEWWTSTHSRDVAPSKLSSVNGFMKGFSSDFINMLKKTKHETALNYIYPSGSGDTYVYDVTYDTFFLPSSKEEHFQYSSYPNRYDGSDKEGSTWEYWIQRKGSTPQDYGSSYKKISAIRYFLADRRTAKNVWLRSAGRNTSGSELCVLTTGEYNSYNSNNNYGCSPACIIC